MIAIGKLIGRLTVGCVFACCLSSLTSQTHGQNALSFTSASLEPATEVQTSMASMQAKDVPALRQLSKVQAETFLNLLDATPQLSAEALPVNGRAGTFYSLQHPEWPPLPSDHQGLPVWQMDGCYLLNDLDYDYQAPLYAGMFSPDGSGDSSEYNSPPDISNYLKYKAQLFSVIDTNNAAAGDTNLYNALLGFAEDTNAFPTLQILTYGSDCLLLKASHFDYSNETRDFCLVVCDKLETPLFKNIDLSTPSNNIQNGGWLVQGSVPNYQVTDPMFLMVSNTSRIYNGFFRAIPYSGAQIEVAGAQPDDTVSNTITLHLSVADLSGVTNVVFDLDASGIPARYSISGSNMITLDTRYNWSGWENLNFKATSKPIVYDALDSLIDNGKLFFSSSTALSLYFDNPIFLAYASDVASLDIGQNDIDFYTTVPATYSATIKNPQSGITLKSFSGSTDPGFIYLFWNFTEQDGSTAYTNDAYVVQFSVTPSGDGTTTLSFTNKIDDGVRQGAGCFITYQEEDPSDMTGSYWNDKADMWARQTLRLLYTDQYKPLSLTQYTTGQVGTNRNHANCIPLSGSVTHWADFMPINLTNKNYSDLNIAGAHCDGETVGYSKAYLNDKFSTYDLNDWLGDKHAGSNWRFRKAAIWGCWSGAETGSLTFPQASGIRPTPQQMTTYCKKNAGFFFGGPVPQIWVTDGLTITTAQAAEFLDQAFMCGANPYPGACDPTYSINWAIQATVNQYPEMNMDPKTGANGTAHPLGFGCPKLIHTTVYDDELTRLNFSHVKEN